MFVGKYIEKLWNDTQQLITNSGEDKLNGGWRELGCLPFTLNTSVLFDFFLNYKNIFIYPLCN